MKQRITLNGVWQMAYCPVGTGTVDTIRRQQPIPYIVPGDVRQALMAAGRMEEPLVDENDLKCRWVEDQEFWCEKRFTLKKSQLTRRMTLVFNGLDLTAEIWLNGQRLGTHNNAFVEHTHEVSSLLYAGENVLLVRLDDGLREAKTHDLARMDEMWNNDQPWRAWMRKPQFVYGWDWTQWLDTCGIWRDVELIAWDEAALTDVYAAPITPVLTENHPCEVEVTACVDRPQATGCKLTCTLTDEAGITVAEVGTPSPERVNRLSMHIHSAHLWWCNGMGEPYLYTLTVRLTDAQSRLLDEWTQKIGLKTITLEQPTLPCGDTGFTFHLNGEPVFCKGANHVPCDCLPGRITPEKELTLVRMARDSHMNMLRIWGGGTYASETLMSACDEAGIMLWHDFMYACGYYPDHDRGFVDNITDEAEKAIRRLRRHVCLVGWSGNNEIQEMHQQQLRWSPDLPFYGRRIYEELLPALVKELCPNLIYRASSPLGGKKQADTHHGDQHIWVLTHVDSHPNYLDLWRFTDFPVKFLSEFGLIGAMSEETARSCISPAHFHQSDPVWIHHSNTSQQTHVLNNVVSRYFGSHAEWSPEEFIRRSQILQAELTRHIYEEFRRRKFFCSGLLFWTLSDSMGIHNWSLIDYGLRRKPVYFALRQSMAPCALTIHGWDVQNDEGSAQWRYYWAHHPKPVTIWGMNDTLRDEVATLCWTLLTMDGEMLDAGERTCYLPANESICLAEIRTDRAHLDPARTILRARLYQGGQLLNETRYFFAPFAEVLARQPRDGVSCEVKGDTVTLHSDQFVWGLHLPEPEGISWEENDFDLWPGEEKTVHGCLIPEGRTVVCHWPGET